MHYWILHVGNQEASNRLRNVAVTVADDITMLGYANEGDENACGYIDGIAERYYNMVWCNKAITGQFVQIQMFYLANLNMYEVEVHGF